MEEVITKVSDIVKFIRSTANVKVKFQTKKKEDRIMWCTLDFGRIPKEFYPKGVTSTADLKEPEYTKYLNVFDLEKKGWRRIPINELEWVNVDGKQYSVKND